MGKESRLTMYQILFIIVVVFNLAVAALQKGEDVTLVSGIPVEYIDEQISVTKGINQIVEDSNHIYILFDNSNDGIVQVYSQEGDYKKTIQCYSHMNGRFQIAVHDHNFYLRDKEGSLYCYYDGEFVEFIDSRQAASLRKSIDFENVSGNFYIRDGSVWKKDGQKDICIVARPFSAMLFQGNFITILGVFIIFLIGISRMFKKR